jgi:hypothetical protein
MQSKHIGSLYVVWTRKGCRWKITWKTHSHIWLYIEFHFISNTWNCNLFILPIDMMKKMRMQKVTITLSPKLKQLLMHLKAKLVRKMDSKGNLSVWSINGRHLCLWWLSFAMEKQKHEHKIGQEKIECNKKIPKTNYSQY